MNLERRAERGHEPEGTRVGAVVGWAFLLLVSVLLSAAVVWWLMTAFSGTARLAWLKVPSSPGGAYHWIDPRQDLRANRRAAEARLSGYAWIDRQHGIVRIPIERAMELVAGDGAAAQAPGGRAPPGGGGRP